MTMEALDTRWTVRALQRRELETAREFLDREHALNIYLAARLHDASAAQPPSVLAVFRGDQLAAVATASANLAVATDPSLSGGEIEQVATLLGSEIIQRSTYLRAIIAPAVIVEPLWNHLEAHYDPPTVVRLSQPVYLLETGTGARLQHVRFSRLDELDLLVPACAAMHREEIGIDPLDRDAFGYRQRVRDLVEQRRSFVTLEKGEIAFKCEISAETPQAVQLMGVWTAPHLRGRGYATRGLVEVCSHIIGRGQAVTLFVNDFNQPARQLYEKLGFRQIGENRALIW